MTASEEDLVQRAKRGDGDAFGALFEMHATRGLGIAIAVLANRADAEEAVQDAAIVAFRSLSSLTNDAVFGSWFSRIIVNKAIDRLRRRKKDQERTVVYNPDGDPGAPVKDVAGDMDVADAVAHLPPEHQAVVRLYYAEGYRTPEIARLLGKPEGTVRRLLSESYRQLRLLLREQDEPSRAT